MRKNLAVWRKYLDFENMVGDLNKIQKLERRIATMRKMSTEKGAEMPDDEKAIRLSFDMLLSRYRYENSFPLTKDHHKLLKEYDATMQYSIPGMGGAQRHHGGGEAHALSLSLIAHFNVLLFLIVLLWKRF